MLKFEEVLLALLAVVTTATIGILGVGVGIGVDVVILIFFNTLLFMFSSLLPSLMAGYVLCRTTVVLFCSYFSVSKRLIEIFGLVFHSVLFQNCRPRSSESF